MGHPPSYINKIMRKPPKYIKYTTRKPLGEGCPIHISSKVGQVLQKLGLVKIKWPPKALPSGVEALQVSTCKSPRQNMPSQVGERPIYDPPSDNTDLYNHPSVIMSIKCDLQGGRC